MKRWRLLLILLATSGCDTLFNEPTPTPPPTLLPPTLTLTAPPPPTQTPIPIPTSQPTATPATEPTATVAVTFERQSFIAYLSGGQLLVTNVTGGVAGGTTQYTQPGVDDQVTDFAWSPSGEFIAYTSAAQGEPHVFFTYAVSASTPTDLGPGSNPAWASDGRSLVYIHQDNLWTNSIYNSPRQITFQQDWAWGNPVFTPDSSAIIVADSAKANMGAQGNTQFYLDRVPLDGTGALTPLPGMTQPHCCDRLPYDLHFSPDGQQLAFSTSAHVNVCGAPSGYYVSAADGSEIASIHFPSLEAALDPAKEFYAQGYSYAWSPAGDALAMTGGVRNCDLNSSDAGKFVAGPQLSVVGLDGTERLTILGEFYWPTFDYTGQMLAAALLDPQGNSRVQIYSLKGDLILDLGDGTRPQFQP